MHVNIIEIEWHVRFRLGSVFGEASKSEYQAFELKQAEIGKGMKKTCFLNFHSNKSSFKFQKKVT